MKLTRTVSYALQATLLLARSKPQVSIPCNQLAARGKLPERFLLQVLRNLVAHGVLESTRGVEGGYRLGRPAGKISLLDVIEAIDGPLISSVPAGDGLPRESRIKLERALADVTTEVRQSLDAVKLTRLLPKRRKRTAARKRAPSRPPRSGRLRKSHR